jgi:hypothetical protein
MKIIVEVTKRKSIQGSFLGVSRIGIIEKSGG